MDNFEEGYRFFEKNSGALVGSFQSEEYINSVNQEIEKMIDGLNSLNGNDSAVAQLKGNVFEFWHAGSFNVRAALNGSDNRTFVDESNKFGSVDISSNFNKNFGLKNYSSGVESAKAQAVSIFQRFNEYQAKGGTDSIDKYLADRGYSFDTVLSDPLYMGQIRVIPKDQLQEAIDYLNRKIATESSIRPDQVKRYQDTLKLLTDRLYDNKGNESVPISKADSEELTRILKERKISADELGLTTEELLQFEYILKESLQAGLTAATITMVLKVAPEIYKAIEHLIKEGEIDEEQFKEIGFAAVSGASEGFIRGSISAALTTCIKGGLLGESVKSISPTVIASVTTIAINAIKNSFAVAKKEKSRADLANDLVRDIYVSTFAIVGGTVSQAFIEVPVLGYMLGSFVGSVVGSFTYDINQKVVLSFCVDTGFTMFGLVEQDYKLPEDIIERIGIETFDYETFELESFEPETFNFASFSLESFVPENIGISFLRRGVIGVNKIGYV